MYRRSYFFSTGGEGLEFVDVYKRYNREVYFFLLSMCENPELAEELTQETFFKALTAIHTFEGKCSMTTWLCQIGKNTYFSWKKKQKHVSNEDVDTAMEMRTDTGVQHISTVEEAYLSKEATLSIYKVLHSLEEPYKEVFTLRVLGELSFKEIGEIFGHKEGWARVTYYRAKIKIQDLIGKEKE